MDLAAKLASYDEIWRKFVNADECFMEIEELEPEKRKRDGAVKRLRRWSWPESVFSLRFVRQLEIESGRKGAGTGSTKLKYSHVSGTVVVALRLEESRWP